MEKEVEDFLKNKLKLELHSQKSKIIFLSHGIDFIGFRNFYYFKLVRRRNVRNIENKIDQFLQIKISKKKMLEIFLGWNAYAMWANNYELRLKIFQEIIDLI